MQVPLIELVTLVVAALVPPLGANVDGPLWEVVKLAIPIISAIICTLVWRVIDSIRHEIGEQKELFVVQLNRVDARATAHENALETLRKEYDEEFEALRRQVRAAELDMIKGYLSIPMAEKLEGRLTALIGEVKEDLKVLRQDVTELLKRHPRGTGSR